MSSPLLITVAPTGAETTKADCPQLPTTLEELVATAKECEAAGAGMIHVHIRDDDAPADPGPGPADRHRPALHEATDLVVQLSTGGSVHDPLDQRLKVLDAEPDSCSLTMGTTNFGDDVFSNPWPFVTASSTSSPRSGAWCRSSSCSTSGRSPRSSGCSASTACPPGGKVHVDFVMGVPGGMPGTAAALVAGVRRCRPRSRRGRRPASAARPCRDVASLSQGGHLRVGMEDVLTMARGVPVESNTQLVERAVEAGRIAQRVPMSTAETRDLLGLPGLPHDRPLVVKVTCGAEEAERCNQGFTVAATAVAAGCRRVAVADRRGGLARVPGRAEGFALPRATPLADLLAAVLAAGRVTVCSQCAARR